MTRFLVQSHLDVLGISADQLDALVLSHGHFDHFGGLVGFLRANAGKLKAPIPLYTYCMPLF